MVQMVENGSKVARDWLYPPKTSREPLCKTSEAWPYKSGGPFVDGKESKDGFV
jgi:hypothetical protein